MVLLTVSPAAKAAIDEYCLRRQPSPYDESEARRSSKLSQLGIGSPIEHSEIVKVSQYLLDEPHRHGQSAADDVAREWRLDTLLKGAMVYQPPPPPKPEQTPEYKALMQKLRAEEEQRQYERMLNPASVAETRNTRPSKIAAFDPAISHGQGADQVDEVTYADVNRQMILIINILISIVCCSVAIWIAARRWSVPQRLGLSMSGSGLVAAAEVAIYMGYIGRIKAAKDKEVKQIETKEVVETWVIDKSLPASASDSLRFRKGKHR